MPRKRGKNGISVMLPISMNLSSFLKIFSKTHCPLVSLTTAICFLIFLPIVATAEPYLDGYAALNEGNYAEAIAIWTAAANEGDFDCIGALRSLYEEGSDGYDDVPEFKPDPVLGDYWRKKEDIGFVAVKEATDLYFSGMAAYESGDYQTAFEDFTASAFGDNDHAKGALGHMFQFGNGVEQSDVMARFWTQEAADAGNIIATARLGTYYYDGYTVEKSYSIARTLFEDAAESGNVSAMLNLGYMYANGHGVDRDDGTAFKYFKQAKDTGNEEAAQVYADYQEHVADYYRRVEAVAARNREIDAYNLKVKAKNDRVRQERAQQPQYSYDRIAAHNYWKNWKPSYCSNYISSYNTTAKVECAN